MSGGERRRRAGLAAALAFVLVLPGCIAWEIRDEVHRANQRIDEVDGMLIATKERLDSTDERIRRTSELIESVQSSMQQTDASIQQTNASIQQTAALIQQTNALIQDVNGSIRQTSGLIGEIQASMKQTDQHLVVVTGVLGETNPFLNTANSGLDRLRILEQMQASLKGINTTLTPLQKAMASLGSTMSFFGMGEEEPEAAPAAAAPSPAAISETPVGAPSGAEADVHATDARSAQRLLGTWILVHPATAASGGGTGAAGGTPPAEVFVLLGDGRFLEGDNGKIRTGGKWSRKGSTLTLTPDTPGKGVTGGTLEIVGISGRSLTLRSGDAFRVYARP